MKARVGKAKAGTLIILLLIAAGIAAIIPLLDGVKKVLMRNEKRFLDAFTKETALVLTYNSISPSILSGIHIDGIEVKDEETGETVASVKKAVLQYNINKLLKGNFKNAFTALTLTEINIEYDDTKESGLRKKLNSFSDLSDSPLTEEKDRVSLNETITGYLGKINSAIFPLPFTINAKKVNLLYRNREADTAVEINRLQFKKGGNDDSVTAVINGSITCSIKGLGTAGVQFTSEGNIVKDFSGSSLTIGITEKKGVDYTLAKTEYLLRYENNLASFNSLQSIIPLRVSGNYDFNRNSVMLRLNTQNFDPFTFIKLSKPTELMNGIKGSRLTSESGFYYNFSSRNISWNTNGNISLTKEIFSADEKISFSMNGNNEDINIKYLEADGDFAEASFEGTFNIPRLEPNGYLTLERFTLPNGTGISGELFIDSIDNAYFAFIPQLFIGNETFTALELTATPGKDSFDFSFVMNDYSHADYETPGEIKINGSYSYENGNFIQASASINNLFLDTVAHVIREVSEEKVAHAIENATSFLKPFIFTNEIYFSTDLKSFSFNAPYALIANTEKEKQMLLLSLDGNEETVHISEFDLLYNDQIFKADFNADISPDLNETAFRAECLVNQIPYSLRGSLHNGEFLELSGDYGLDVFVNFENEVTGSIQLVSLPLAVKDYIFSLSSQITLSYSEKYGINADVERLSIEESSGKIALEPKIELQARLNNEGFAISNISYVDNSSSLDGKGQFLWNVNEGKFDSLNAELALKNPLNEESFSLNGSVTNPLGLGINTESITNDFYFTGDVELNKLRVSRFVQGQFADDTITASIFASGTVNNPLVSLNVSGFSMEFWGMPLYAEGSAFMENKTVTVQNSKVTWSNSRIKDIEGEIDIGNFNGELKSVVEMDVMENKTFSIPFEIKLENLADESENFIPDYFQMLIEAKEINGNFLTNLKPFSITVLGTPDKYYINSDETLGISSWFAKTGEMYLEVDKTKPFTLTVEGVTQGMIMDLTCKDIDIDLSRLSYLINTDQFSIYKGNLTGSVMLTGLGTDPDIEGQIELKNLEFNLPSYVPEHIYVYNVKISSDPERIIIPKTNFRMKNGGFTAKAELGLDRWTLTEVNASLQTDGTKGIPVDINIPLLRIKGNTEMNLTATLLDNDMNLEGSVNIQNTEIKALTNFDLLDSFEDEMSSVSSINLRTNINLMIGQKVQIVLNPLLRGLIAPQTPVLFTMNSEEGTWNLKSDIVLRGGEVTWLNRNFYIKEGSISLNETQSNFNPTINLKAETRERDSNGNPITISLTAKRQSVRQFNPVFSSVPAKSEREIREILGQIITGDLITEANAGNSSFLVATGLDYGLQVTFLRSVENSLRDLLNFDIFSLRSPVIQNTARILQDNPGTKINAGNFLDNSTVYIGKYFGSSLYVDALMRWSYDNSGSNEESGFGNLHFEPEIGFEVASPFANIRWSLAPDITDIMRGDFNWVPAASITLSWKFSF